MSLIQNESGGVPGAQSGKGDFGLMQVREITLRDYNQRMGGNYTLSQLTGKTAQDIQVQIRVGTNTLGYFWRVAYKDLTPKLGNLSLEQIVKLSDLYYATGGPGARKLIRRVNPPTFENLATAYPKWTAIKHARKIWNWTEEQQPTWNMDAINEWMNGGNEEVEVEAPLIAKTGKNGFLLALCGLALASYSMKGKKK